MRIQTRKQQEQEWEQHHLGGIISGISPILSSIAAYKDHQVKPTEKAELERVLETIVNFWGIHQEVLNHWDSWPDKHLPDFLIKWRDK